MPGKGFGLFQKSQYLVAFTCQFVLTDGLGGFEKCMLRALLEPTAQIGKYELEGKGFQSLALLEEAKALPWNAVYDEFCQRNNVPVGNAFIAEVEKYEAYVLSSRK